MRIHYLSVQAIKALDLATTGTGFNGTPKQNEIFRILEDFFTLSIV
jgi:hypothetical protein